MLGSLGSGVIGLAFEGISSFLHHKRHKALTKAINIMKEKSDLQHNRVLGRYYDYVWQIQFRHANGFNQYCTSYAKFDLLERENVCRKDDRMG